MARLVAIPLSGSGLDPFLYAEVGTEANGSELTVLSIFARLGFDPWTEAGRLVTLPKSVATSWFAEKISQMPLPAPALAGAAETASRLIALLPADTQVMRTGVRSEVAAQLDAASTPRWAMLLMASCALALGAAASAHAPAAQTAPTQSGPNHPGTPEPRDGTRVMTHGNLD